MAKHIFWIRRVVAIWIIVAGLVSGKAMSQTEAVVSVDPEVSYRYFDTYRPEKPVRYGTVTNRADRGMQVLDSLTPSERNLIESAVSPPAVGILRQLNTPIRFRMPEAPVQEGGEVDFAGGYLQTVHKDTVVWTTSIRSKGADIIRLFFSEGYIPAGVKVNIFSDREYALTLHEMQGALGEYGFYAPSVFSDRVTIQVVIPSGIEKDRLWFVIPSVIHEENRYLDQSDNSVPCQQDVNCTYASGYSNILMLKRSTARLLFLVGSLYYLCSGGLINDSRSIDFQPFLLTANHCFSTQASANSLESWFDYYTTSCNGSNNNNYIIVSGANLIKTNSQSDFTLVLLKQYPTAGYDGRWFLGWSTSAVANNATLHSVHHPAGVRQRYSKLQNKTSPSFNCGTTHFHHTTTLGGGSEGGSSGSTIVNESGQIVGQLYGKCYSGSYDECSFTTFNGIWGKFSSSYNNNNLAYWLNNGGASVSMSNNPSSSLAFGNVNVGANSTLTVTITNTGTVPNYMNLETGSATISGTNASNFSIVSGASLYLSPGQSGTISVRFSPTSAGAKTAVLNIPHNANNIATPRTITLTGTGVVVCKTCPDYDAAITPAEAWATTTTTLPDGGCRVYRVTVTDGMTYTFQTGCSSGATANFDTYLSLRSAGCTVLMEDDDGCESYRSRIIWTATYSGYAYLKVNGYLNVGGTYTLAYQAQPPALTPCSNVIPIAGTGIANGVYFWSSGSGTWSENNITCDTYCYGSEQVYSFVAPADGWYRITVDLALGINPWVSFMWREGDCFIENWEAWSCLGTLLNPGEYSQTVYWTAGTTYYIVSDAIEFEPDMFEGMRFHLVNAGIPDTLAVQNISLGNNSSECHDAYQSISVAGGGTTYTVNPGGQSTLIAGLRISLRPGTKVFPGGRLHAFISTDGVYCPAPQNPLGPDNGLMTVKAGKVMENNDFSIYPNPVTGSFTLAFSQKTSHDCRIRLYNTSGVCLIDRELRGNWKYDNDIGHLASGMYLVQIISGDSVVSAKIVKQ